MSLPGSTLHIGVWNIDCLHSRLSGWRTSKFTHPDVCNLLNTFDIFFLSETHCGVSDKVGLDGYHIVQNLSPKSRNATRNFGGLAVAVKNKLLKGVTFLKITNSEYLWIKLSKTFFSLSQDVYIFSVYISPHGSSYSHQRDDIFTLIENDLVKYSTLGNCLFLGDFNAQTSTDADFVVNDDIQFLDIETPYGVDTFIPRNSIDKHVIDTHGKSLLHLCKNTLGVGNL